MAIVSYRIYCSECTDEIVLKESEMDDHEWKVSSKSANAGVCPACNPAADATGEYAEKKQSVPFEDYESIGDAGAENLRDAGIVTREDVKNASDEEILDVSWVGEGGLESIRKQVR